MFPCTECEKTFSQKHHLKQHLEIHNGKRPYSCDVCMKAFIHGYDLKRHMRIHTGEKPYSCDVCNMEFAQNSRLKQHKKTHTGESLWKCEICEKNFIQSCELKMHLRIHTGEKPFNCDVCNKPFARPGDLVRHKRIHTDEKPYSCDICNVAFRDNASFWGHKKSKKHLKRLNGNDLLSSVPNNLEVYIKEEINEDDPLAIVDTGRNVAIGNRVHVAMGFGKLVLNYKPPVVRRFGCLDRIRLLPRFFPQQLKGGFALVGRETRHAVRPPITFSPVSVAASLAARSNRRGVSLGFAHVPARSDSRVSLGCQLRGGRL